MTVSVCKLVRNAGQEMKFERILPLLKKKKKVNADNCLSLQ